MEKIQMTEEQARIHFQECNPYHINRKVLEDYYIERCKEKGYIRKSELQTLVDECEEEYREMQIKNTHDHLHFKQNKLIKLFKVDHPEIKK